MLSLLALPVYSLSHKDPEPLAFRETDRRLIVFSPYLAVLWVNPLSLLQAGSQHSDLLCIRKNKSGLLMTPAPQAESGLFSLSSSAQEDQHKGIWLEKC